MRPALPELLDALCVAAVGIFAIVGTARGFLRGLLRIVACLLALVVGRMAAPLAGPGLSSLLHWDATVAAIFVWVVVAAAVAAALGLCLLRFDPWIEAARIAVLDSVLGFVLGVAFGAGVVVLTILTIGAFTKPGSPIEAELAKSRSGRFARAVADELKPIVEVHAARKGA